MSEIKKFEHSQLGLSLRVSKKDGEPWFFAKDVCDALGHKNPTVAMQSLEADEKAKLNLGLSGGASNVISESGLYALVLRSRKPEARAFRKWVTSEVLPSIRKGGMYMTEKTATQAVAQPKADALAPSGEPNPHATIGSRSGLRATAHVLAARVAIAGP